MLILPAIDLLGGRCVRLFQGDYAQATEYSPNPTDVARSFAEQGARWLHVVDLDGARTGAPANVEAVASIVKAFAGSVEVGGGIRDLDSARRLLDLGVDRVVFGSRLVNDPDFARQAFEELGDRAVAGIDARDGRVAVHGWTESSSVRAEDLARRLAEAGARRMIATDIATDGAMSGPNLAFLKSMAEAAGVPVIASGGIATLADIADVASLGSLGVEGAIIGKALYERAFTVAEAIQVAAPVR
ncbi:MAG: 1-(5-phosphoribosyl)-5-[(5-phosphoribosylamino)methylideneamino]imidazole-4-carboxamide isomerase [Fimbriimonadaceae bacterium]